MFIMNNSLQIKSNIHYSTKNSFSQVKAKFKEVFLRNLFKIIFHLKQQIIFYDSVYKCNFDINMRATITSNNFVQKNNKKNRDIIGRSSSHQSSKKNISKNNKSKQKKNIQINDKHGRLEQNGNQGRIQYFNRQKKSISKKVVCQKNSEYISQLNMMGEFVNQKNLKSYPNDINKLKLENRAGVITFDGKIKKIDPIIKNKPSNQNNKSVQNYTDIMHRHSMSKSKQSKLSKLSKSVSKERKSRNAKSYTKSVRQCHYISKSMRKSEDKTGIEQTQTKGSIQQQYLYDPKRLENLDLSLLQEERKACQQCSLKIYFLKKVSVKARSQSITFVSKLCSQMNLSNDVFFLTIFLLDRYINDQIILNKIKVLSLSCLLLCLKLDDCSMSRYLYKQIFNISNNNTNNFQIQQTVKKQKKKKKEEQKRKLLQQKLKIMNHKLKAILKQEFQSVPKPEQIIQFQSLMLIRQNFKIRKFQLSFWIDSATVAWDGFLMEKMSQSEFSVKLTFCYCEKPQNYYYLTQILQACLYDIKVYSFPFYQLVFSSIFLICRVNAQAKEKGFDYYRNNLQKSSNLLFTDTFGINALFGEFLQKFSIQIGNILPCCKFISTYLNSNILNRVESLNVKMSRKKDLRSMFNKHIYNEKIIQFSNQTE